MKKRYIILEDGTVFEGIAFGADDGCTGELVFTTGMCGYLETLTDPSYYGQIVLQTFPMIGNYGAISSDFEGKCCVRGYVVRELCDAPSNFRSEGGLDSLLRKWGIPGVCGIDTRELTKRIREHGVMNAAISDTPDVRPEEIARYRITGAVEAVTVGVPEAHSSQEHRFRVALLDFGAKKNIVRELVSRGCDVDVLPASTSAEKILSGGYDGVMLSNGPGDPAENEGIIRELSKLLGRLPIFGICLGHQLLAIAAGGSTAKMKYGHRGVNQPVRELSGSRTYITSQNHGYEVVSGTVKRGVISYINANDGTCEGIDYSEDGAFTVQFHPEACSGPRDTGFLFDRFIAMMGGRKNAAQ